MGGRWIARSCVRSVRARERGLRQYITCAPLCFESCSAFGHTDGLCVATPAPVKGVDVGKSLCSGALVLPHSRRRWPTKCQSHEDVVFCTRAQVAQRAICSHGAPTLYSLPIFSVRHARRARGSRSRCHCKTK